MFQKTAIAAIAAAALMPALAQAQAQGGTTTCQGVVSAYNIASESAGGDPSHRYSLVFQNVGGGNLRSLTISFHGFDRFVDAQGTAHRINIFSPSLNITNVNNLTQQIRFGSGNVPNMWFGSGGMGSVALSFDGSGGGSPRIDISNCMR